MKYARPDLVAQVRRGWKRVPAVALLGPRQCGKSTLARWLCGQADTSTYFDLENPADLQALAEPMTTLSPLRGLVIIDEVQRRPELFPVLRVLLDRRPIHARFLILGSAAPDLLRQTSETLAGRVALVEMSGLHTGEVGAQAWRRLWLRGGFPRSFLASSEQASMAWREDFIRTFLERDLPGLGVRVPSATMRRFWTMVAHYSGGIWNASAIGSSLGQSHTTIQRHLDLLSSALMIRVLRPWHENLAKRQVKAPKVYLRDCGLLHALLGIGTRTQLDRHPQLGASWEGFVIEQILARVPPGQAYYWRTQAGAELDLMLMHRGKRWGIEIKYADAPRRTPSMTAACNDLGLHRLMVVYPGDRAYRLGPNIEVLPLEGAVAQLTGSDRSRAATPAPPPPSPARRDRAHRAAARRSR